MKSLIIPVLVAGAVAVPAAPALAAGEQVSVVLTTTSDSAGRSVTRGLQAQAPTSFASSSAAAPTTITVDENTRYQTFQGGGASITDTTAHLLRGGPVTAAVRDEAMRRLFSPADGIGLSFVRNPIGASDLSRPGNVSLDDTCCDLNDFNSNGYDTNVRLLTQQAKGLNPALRIMGVPWSAPGWMKDNGRMDQMGWLKWEYYPLYAQYLVKYIQSVGVPVDYLSVQNEPNCCHADNPPAQDYPGMNWNPSGLVEFTKNHLYPALHAAGLNTKVLVHDWNYGDYANFGSGVLNDAGIRSDANFGGIAWHGYFGDPAVGTEVHNQYPTVPQFSTEHSGGQWITNQHNEDLTDIISYARNFSGSLVKWSLGVDASGGPHNGGCGTCTGLITVHDGRVDYTVEYYTTGHLTKFVKPGAQRIASNDGSAVRNVAWRNPDGSKALIAHNPGTSAQAVKVIWGGQSFTYTLPARTTATFTWNGVSNARSGPVVSAANNKCLDVTDGSTADGNLPQMWACYAGSANQTWTLPGDGTVRALGKCLDVQNNGTGDGAVVHLWACYPGLPSQTWQSSGGDLMNAGAGKCLDIKDNNQADGAKLQLWTCTGSSNQKWTVP